MVDVGLESTDMAIQIYRYLACAVLAALVAAGAVGAHAQGKPALVAAASDLKFALDAIAGEFQRSTKFALTLSYGSSGNFARQIQQGAPFELFLSADEAYVFRLADAGLTRDRGVRYAIGRIALYVPKGSPIALDAELKGLRGSIARIDKLAIANPEHAPYGRAAREALDKLGLWDAARARLVLGENVSQAAQFVTSGAAQAGIIALSLAVANALAKQGEHVVIDDRLHAPLNQRMVLAREASAAAEAFYRHLQSPAARETLHRFGFGVPDA